MSPKAKTPLKPKKDKLPRKDVPRKTAKPTRTVTTPIQVKKEREQFTDFKQRPDELAALQATVLDISSLQPLPELLNLIMERSCNLLRASSGGIYLCDIEKQQINCVVSYKTARDFTGTILKYGEGVAGTVAQTGKSLIIDDYRTWPGRAQVYDQAQSFSAVMAVPLIWQGNVTGVIDVMRTENWPSFTQEDQELLNLLAAHTALAVENTRLYESLDQELNERRKAEQARQESEMLYRKAIEVAGAVPYYESYYDNGARIKYEFIGEGIRQITGYGPEEFNAPLWDSLVLDIHLVGDLAGYSIDEAIQRVRSGESPIWKCEHRIRHRDGEIRWVFEAAVELRDDQGVSHGSIGMYQDITQRKEAEEKLRGSEERFKALSQAAFEGILIHERGVILDANQKMADLFGFQSPEELIGMNGIEMLPLTEQSRNYLKSSFTNSGLGVSEIEVIRQDGSTFPAETQGRDITFAGRKARVVSMRDITERKQTEKALQESEANQQLILDNIEEVIYSTRQIAPNSAVGDVQYVNNRAEHILGYPVSEFMENPGLWFSLVHPDDILPLQERTAVIFESKLPGIRIYRLHPKKSSMYHWFEDLVVPHLDQAGNIIGTFGVARDITERKQAEQLQAALNEIANMAQTTFSLNDLFASIHKTLNAYMPAENFYIAIYDKQYDLLSFPYFVDQSDTAPQPHKPGNGLTEYVLRTRQPLLATPQVLEEMMTNKQVALLGIASIDWIGVPLTFGDETFGVMVIQTYTDKVRLTQKDLEILTFVSTQTALVIKRKQAEETLLQFREVMDESNDAIYFIDPETSRYIDFNRNAMEFLGYTKDELSQLGVINIAQHVHNIEEWRERVDLIGKNNGLVFQTSYRRKNGSVFPVEVSARILKYDGKPIMVAVVRDVAERTQAETGRERQFQELKGLNAIASACAFATESNDEESLLNVTSIIVGKVLYPEDFGFFMVDKAGLLRPHPSYHQKNGTPNEFIRPGEGLIGQAAQEGKARRSGDVRLEKNYIAASPTSLSELAVPLKIKEHVLGVINAESNQLNAFSEADERLLGTAADQIATALGRIRLQKETIQRAREFASLYETSNALSVENDLTVLLQVIVEHAATLLNASIGAMYLFNKTAQDLETVVATSSDIPAGIHLHLGEGAAGRVAQTRLPMRLDDYSNWEGRSPKYEGQIFRAILEVPMLFGGELIGVLTSNEAGDSERKFTEADEHLLSLFASQAAGAIHATRLLEETRRRAEEFTTLYETTHDLAMQQDLSTVMAIITKRATVLLGVPNATITLYDAACDDLEIAATIGPDLPIGTHRNLGDGLAGHIAQTRMPLIIDDYQHWEHRSALYDAIPYTAIMGVPLLYGGNLLGVLDVSEIAPSKRTFNEADIRLLSLFAGQAASAIANAQLFENLKKSNTDITLAYDTTIEGWSRAMELRDRETEGHTLRVTDLTLNLARGMHLNESFLTQIRRGSLLHDIGKMGVPDSILLKDGNLNEEEWVIMRKHPQLAYEMLSAIDYLREALDIPSNHHEKWDGTGYPRGLKGEQIPLAARIFAVVDVWDAIRSDRPYRKGWDTEKAIEYIKSQSGTHFDPKVVEAFLNLLRKE